MKINYLYILIFLNISFSESVGLFNIQNLATNFLNSQQSNNQDYLLLDVYTKKENGVTTLYIINFQPSGFVVVPSNNKVRPILAYSFKENLDINNLSIQADYIISSYSQNILDIINNDSFEVDSSIENSWQEYSINQQRDENFREINPLITANWNQGGDWNFLCPNNSLVGCVAVAMGQVMYYWNYPNQGTGYSQYYSPEHGMISVNFSDYIYNFDNMNDDNPTYDSQLLLYHAGAAVEMNYSPWASGASVCWDGHSAQSALDDNFNYYDEITCIVKNNYSMEEWNEVIKNQLDRGWPVIYRGYSDDAGHAWNIDGYQDDYFHCNWGWGGSSNGYFYFDDLNGGGFSFIENQAALINIVPDNIEQPIALFEYQIDDLQIDFTNLSDIVNEDVINSYFWDFGNGNTSINNSPIHNYEDYGVYEVSLIVMSEYGFESIPHIESIEIVNYLGDVNNDLSIDILDVIQLMNIILMNDFSNNQIEELDFNNDDRLNILDVIVLIQIVLDF